MPLPKEDRYTLADALAWDEQDRIELIDGAPVMMAPPSRAHQEALMELSAQLHAYLRGKKCKVYPAPFAVRLFEREGERPEDVDTLVEPDISVVCDPSKLDDIGCKGAPDLIVEILSPSTRKKDCTLKVQKYMNAGVREYWIVDPDKKAVITYRFEGEDIPGISMYTFQDKVPVGIFEGSLEIDFQEILGRLRFC